MKTCGPASPKIFFWKSTTGLASNCRAFYNYVAVFHEKIKTSIHLNPINAVILLQKVMVSLRTHFVKNHESQSWTSESQLKNESEIENAQAFIM